MSKIEMFTFCDFAQEVQGKLTIVGAFNEIKSKNFPFVYDRPFTLVARLNYKESKEKENVIISIIAPNGNIIENFKIDYPVSVDNGKSTNINFMMKMDKMNFEMEGIYKVVISNQDIKEEIELYLEKI